MSAVVEAISDVVGDVLDFAGDVVETVVETAADVVETVADTAVKVVEGAIDDPIGTIAKVGTAIYAPYLLPVVNAGVVIANGGDLDDALTAAAVSYVAPQVGGYVAGEIAGTAFGDMLGEAAAATGIESLPGAVASGIGRAATGTVVGLARGQDFDDALESGAISGVASVLGRVAGSEADTGSAFADRMIGTAVNAATNAGLRGRDVDDAVENAIAMDLFNTGLGMAGKEIKTALKDFEAPKGIASLEETPTTVSFEETVVSPREAIATETGVKAPDTLLASLEDKTTVSDATRGAPPGFYVDFDGSVKPIQRIDIEGVASKDEVAKQYSDDMFNALVDTFSQKSEQTRVDELGNVYDLQGNFIGYASDFGMSMTTDPSTGGTAWQTEQGETIRPTSIISEVSSQPSMLTGFTAGDQEGDYPVQIINNPDGSVTSVEANGTSYTFNTDGSITFTDYEGNQNVMGGSQDPYEVDQQTTRNEFTFGQGLEDPYAVDQQTSRDETNALTGLVDSLIGTSLPNVSTPSVSTPNISFGSGPRNISYAPFVAGAAAIGSMMDDGGSYNPYGVDPYGFGWNPYDIYEPIDGRAYGQRYFEPTYAPVGAAAGGLMSLQYQPTQYIQPTIPSGMTSNPMTIASDPTSSVQMYSRGGISHLGLYSDGGRMLKGPGDGMSDDIPATIAGRQPARLANEEFVVPADVVSHLGNGSSEAGAKVLYKMMADVRKARTGKPKQAKQINPQRFMPRR